jgi:hypothetical protein
MDQQDSSRRNFLALTDKALRIAIPVAAVYMLNWEAEAQEKAASAVADAYPFAVLCDDIRYIHIQNIIC